MTSLSLCDYSDMYKFVKVTVTFPNTVIRADPNNRNKKAIFKNCANK